MSNKLKEFTKQIHEHESEKTLCVISNDRLKVLKSKRSIDTADKTVLDLEAAFCA